MTCNSLFVLVLFDLSASSVRVSDDGEFHSGQLDSTDVKTMAPNVHDLLTVVDKLLDEAKKDGGKQISLSNMGYWTSGPPFEALTKATTLYNELPEDGLNLHEIVTEDVNAKLQELGCFLVTTQIEYGAPGLPIEQVSVSWGWQPHAADFMPVYASASAASESESVEIDPNTEKDATRTFWMSGNVAGNDFQIGWKKETFQEFVTVKVGDLEVEFPRQSIKELNPC